MGHAKKTCPKCSGEMIDGFVIDNALFMTLASQWVKGSPRKARPAFGVLPEPGIALPKAEDLIPIGTFRCRSCGFLESYALEEFAAS